MVTAAVETRAKRVAIVTYNRIGEGEYSNGMTKGENVQLFVAQNGHKSKWAADPDLSEDRKKQIRLRVADSVMNQLDLTDMDHVYIYVGSNGSEEVIRLSHNLPGDKVTYVMCSCGWERKKHMISNAGNVDAQIIECECGGRRTLAKIAKDILNGTTK